MLADVKSGHSLPAKTLGKVEVLFPFTLPNISSPHDLNKLLISRRQNKPCFKPMQQLERIQKRNIQLLTNIGNDELSFSIEI